MLREATLGDKFLRQYLALEVCSWAAKGSGFITPEGLDVIHFEPTRAEGSANFPLLVLNGYGYQFTGKPALGENIVISAHYCEHHIHTGWKQDLVAEVLGPTQWAALAHALYYANEHRMGRLK